jgi:hypothetical protein
MVHDADKENTMASMRVLILSVLLFAFTAAAAEVDVTGRWVGTWTSLRASGYNGSVALHLYQVGDHVFGTAFVTNTICSPSRQLSGTLSGPYLYLQMSVISDPDSGDGEPFLLSENWGIVTELGNAMSFVYYFSNAGDDCFGDGGTWFVAKEVEIRE